MAISILAFYGTFFIAVVTIIYISVNLRNKRAKIALDKFIAQAHELTFDKIEHIKLQRYWVSSGMMTWVYLNSSCDLYLFENYMALIRSSDFIFKAFFAPIIITQDVNNAREFSDYLEVYKPVKIAFNSFRQDELDIKLPDPVYNHVIIDITIKGLTEGQKAKLEKIKNWC